MGAGGTGGGGTGASGTTGAANQCTSSTMSGPCVIPVPADRHVQDGNSSPIVRAAGGTKSKGRRHSAHLLASGCGQLPRAPATPCQRSGRRCQGTTAARRFPCTRTCTASGTRRGVATEAARGLSAAGSTVKSSLGVGGEGQHEQAQAHGNGEHRLGRHPVRRLTCSTSTSLPRSAGQVIGHPGTHVGRA